MLILLQPSNIFGMKQIYLSALLLFSITSFSAQETKTLWQKNISSSTQDFLTAMTGTLDRQILLFGSSINTKTQSISMGDHNKNKGYDFHAIKLSQEGNVVWEKFYGGTKHDYLMSSVATREGGFLLAGTSYSNLSGDKKENNLGESDVWLIRLNENGDEIWQKTLGTKGRDEASTIIQTTNLDFFVAGNLNSAKELMGSKDVFVSKISKDGKLLHTTLLGGTGLDEVQEMIATPDGGSMVVIYSQSGKAENKKFEIQSSHNNATRENYGSSILQFLNPNNTSDVYITGKTEVKFGLGDYWIVKLDKDAQIEWQKTYGGNEDDIPKTLAFTDKGYLIGGESRSNSSGNKQENVKEGTDLWLIHLDKNGNELWQKSYNFGNRDVLMSMNTIRKSNADNESQDNGFVLGGYTQAEEKIGTDDEKFWMLYIDNDGKENWRKYVEGKSKKKEERLVSAELQSDGTFLLAGTSAERLGEENWKVVKLGDQGLDNLIEQQDLKIYPNPVDDYCYVELNSELFDKSSEIEINLHDMSGKQIQTLKTKQAVTKINTSHLPQGVYIVTATTNLKSANAKIVKR